MLKMWNVSLKRCIGYAYKIPEAPDSGRPGNGSTNSATTSLPKPITWPGNPNFGRCFQPLLADRFRLQLHHETRTLPGYTLTVAKGGIKATPADPDRHSAGKTEVSGFFDVLASPPSTLTFRLSALLGRPVIDMTASEKRRFDFHLRWTPDDTPTGGGFGAFSADSPAGTTRAEAGIGESADGRAGHRSRRIAVRTTSAFPRRLAIVNGRHALLSV